MPPPQPPSLPAPQLSAQPRPPAQRGPEPGDGEEEGGWKRARSGRRGPSRPFPRLFLCHYRRASRSSSAFPPSPLKERGRGGRVQPAAAPGPNSRSPSHLLPVLPFHPPCSKNALAPEWTRVSPGPPPPRPPSRHAHRHVLGAITIASALGPLSVPSPSVPSPHAPGGHMRRTRRVPKKKRGPATRDFTGARSSGLSALGLRLGERPGGGGGSRHPRPRHAWFL